MTYIRPLALLAIAGVSAFLSGCVVAPIGRPVAYYPTGPGPVYVEPAPVLVVPAPYYGAFGYRGYGGYGGYGGYRGYGYRSYRGYRNWR